MIEIFDIASIIILTCLAASWWAVSPVENRWIKVWGGLVLIAAVVFMVRISAGALAGMDMTATAMMIWLAIILGRHLLVNHSWPQGIFIVAVSLVTAVGIYLRADRFDQILHDSDRQLQPDVRYYQQQALKTSNPCAAGLKSPLWSAMHASLLCNFADRDLAMRILSWSFGVLVIPITTFAIGRLFEPIVGVIVGGTLAVDPWLIDLCCEGLREEFGLCLWMVVVLLLFGVQRVSWRRVLAAGLTGGALLLLRNLAIVPLALLLVWAITTRGWSIKQAVVGILLPIVIVSPFYINQWRVYGDPFAMEKRDARYHANLEFNMETAPPGLSMPTVEEKKRDLYAGEPISPVAYLLCHRSLTDFLSKQWEGLSRIVLGEPFHFQASRWFRLICAVGLIATLLVKEQRFVILFFLASVLGIRAHLLAVNQLEQRLLLPVMVVWLTAGWWLLASAARWGGRRWILSRDQK
ncbi:MAG: hypothetical protein JSV03_14040 [Planctomycetota bacterium]|nr:MAG: hypothetical protein JSV03_14040 [Planctomycetota bacterium]